jgi:hypothetical protein
MSNLASQYLDALASLTPHHAHELRGRLGTCAVQLDLATELLAHGPVSAANLERARVETTRARAGLRDLTTALEVWLGLTRAPADAAACDLQEFARELEQLLAPAARDRRCRMTFTPPTSAAVTPLPRETVRRAAIAAAVKALDAVPHGGRIEVRFEALEAVCSMTLTSFDAGDAELREIDWGEMRKILSAALESNACTVRSTHGRIELCFPTRLTTD